MLNDKEMDVLMRRYAKGAAPDTPVEHPDADELNAFAEGALPPAARQRYVSHFADCDDCRKLVSQLAVTAGAPADVRIPASESVAEPWWRKLGVLPAPATLRYAAFAVVLFAVVGIAFVVWRRPAERNAEMIAQNQGRTGQAEPVVSPAIKESEVSRHNSNADAATRPVSYPTAPPAADQKQPELNVSLPPPPPKPAEGLLASENLPGVGASRTDEARAQSSPSYAPAPSIETYRVDNRARERQSTGAIPSGPRRSESYDKYKDLDRVRSGDLAKSRDDEQPKVANQPMSAEQKEDDSMRPSTSQVATARARNADESAAAARKSKSEETGSDEAPERSVGGRKFKHQGNAWVDSKFKSSMPVRSIARGSEDFDKLESGLRSIANQLSGEIVVVWKGKAYRIR